MTKIKIITHDTQEFILVENEYCAKELAETLNNTNKPSIAIGGVVFACIDIKRVIPIVDDTPLTPIEPPNESESEDIPLVPLEPSIPEDSPTHPIDAIPINPIDPIDPVEPDEETDDIPLIPLDPSEENDRPTNIPDFGEVNIPELEQLKE